MMTIATHIMSKLLDKLDEKNIPYAHVWEGDGDAIFFPNEQWAMVEIRTPGFNREKGFHVPNSRLFCRTDSGDDWNDISVEDAAALIERFDEFDRAERCSAFA